MAPIEIHVHGARGLCFVEALVNELFCLSGLRFESRDNKLVNHRVCLWPLV